MEIRLIMIDYQDQKKIRVHTSLNTFYKSILVYVVLFVTREFSNVCFLSEERRSEIKVWQIIIFYFVRCAHARRYVLFSIYYWRTSLFAVLQPNQPDLSSNLNREKQASDDQ